MSRTYPVIDVGKTGQNLKNVMKEKGLCVKDIQKFLGLSTPQSIYHWFEGRSMPTLDNLYALSELFQMPVDMLIKGNRRYAFTSFSDAMRGRIYMYYNSLKKVAA